MTPNVPRHHWVTYPSVRRSSVPALYGLTWDKLAHWLRRCAQSLPRPGDKRDLPVWAPHVLSAPRRANANVVRLHAMTFDYDSLSSWEEWWEVLREWHSYERIWYTTWSSTPDAPRVRLVLPLAKPIPAEHWRPTYLAQLERSAPQADRACCDPARVHAAPHAGCVFRWTSRRWFPAHRDYVPLRRFDPPIVVAAPRTSGPTPDHAKSSNDQYVRGQVCPACGRRSLWRSVRSTTWHCDHLVSCGWHGTL